MSFQKANPPSVNTNPKINPILPMAGVPPQLISILNDRFREIRNLPATASSSASSNSGGGGSASSEIFQRTLLIKNAAVANDIADHVTCYGGGQHTITLVTAVLRKAIASDLVVRVNNISPAPPVGLGPVVVGTFTVPSSTPVDTPVTFTHSDFTAFTLPDLSVFTWDITMSDGSQDPAGIASFTVEWNP